MGIAANFIASGAAWYLGGPNAGLVMLGIGFVLLFGAYLFPKKHKAPDDPLPLVHQENKQTQTFNPQFNPTFNPQQNVYVGTRDDEAERERKERDRHDQMVFEHIKQQHEHRPNMTYLVADVASAVSLTFYETDQSLKRLFVKGMVYRDNIDAPGDYVYWFRGPE